MFYLPFEARKRTQEDCVDLLRRHSRMAGDFLEIGPDIGLSASAFAKVGSFEHLWISDWLTSELLLGLQWLGAAMTTNESDFEKWLDECRAILIERLHCTPDFAERVISGAGIDIYQHQFSRGLSPERCIELELCYWND